MFFSSKEVGTDMLFKKLLIVQRLIFIGAVAGAGEKNTPSRSKTDRLRNTGCNNSYFDALPLGEKKI